MIKQKDSILHKSSVFIQTAISIACFYLAIWITETYISHSEVPEKDYVFVSMLIFLLWFIVLDLMGLGRNFRLKMYSSLIVEYFMALVIGNIVLYAAINLLQLTSISRTVLFVFFGVNLFVLYAYRISMYRMVRLHRRQGQNAMQVLLIADDQSEYFIDRLISEGEWGFKINIIMTQSSKIIQKYDHMSTIIPFMDDLDVIIDKYTIDEVVYCKSDFNQKQIQKYIAACNEIGVVFHLQSQLMNFVKTKSKVSFFNQMTFLTFRNTPENYFALVTKSVFEFIFSLLILVVLSPVFLGIALFIKLEDGGPVFFKQTRVGLSGRYFGCYKFRTMVVNAEELKADLQAQNEQEGPVFKIKNDPRITKIGRFLRRTSLDELPQFINVIKGEMAVVGPRPPIPEEVRQYKRWQSRRLSMKPGITCIWQVSGRNDIPFEQWMQLDLQYIDNWSLKLDLVLLIKTIKTVLMGSGH